MDFWTFRYLPAFTIRRSLGRIESPRVGRWQKAYSISYSTRMVNARRLVTALDRLLSHPKVHQREKAAITDDGQPSAALELARALLRDSREELKRADEKASSLLAAIGVAVSALLTGAVGGSWLPTSFGQDACIAWWLSIASTGVAICFLVSALLPRLPFVGDTKHVTYFAEVVRIERRAKTQGSIALEDLGAAVRYAATDVFQHTLNQIRPVSWIVLVKYRRIRAAIVSMAMAAASLGIALTLQAIVR